MDRLESRSYIQGSFDARDANPSAPRPDNVRTGFSPSWDRLKPAPTFYRRDISPSWDRLKPAPTFYRRDIPS